MNRKFTPRETLLLAVLAVLLVGVCYSRLVWLPTSDAITAADSETAAAQTDLDTQTIVAQRMREMEKALEEVRGEQSGPVVVYPPYNNLQNVILLLNETLSGATDYDLDFAPVTFEGGMAQRMVTMRFTCQGYDHAKSIVSQLYGGPYRCEIGDFSMRAVAAGESQADLVSSPVSVSLSITFYESC